MKTISLLAVLLFSLCLQAYENELYLELGQNHIIKNASQHLWVENSKILAAEQSGQGVSLKALNLGSTQIRHNNEVTKVFVVPLGSLKTVKDWSGLVKKFIQLKVDYCEEVVCLKGKIFRLEDFEKIIQLIRKNSSTLYFAFEIHSSIINKIQNYLESFQREKGLTPLRIIFSSPWKILYSNKELGNDYKKEMSHVGVLAIESKQKVDISDNIKVSIQVTEVKKEFSRSLGIRFPGSYSAQVVDNKASKLLPFDLALNANENEGNIKILASPNLVCRSGKEAEFFAGGEFPIRVLNYKVNDVVWKKYGINLKIKPQIDAVGQMSLQIDSEVSSLDESTKVDGIPGLHTHRVSSYFDLIRSRTIALSGLIKNEQGQSREGLPFLRQIPILGRLFSSHDFRESKTELVIFVTPELLKYENE